MHDVIGVTDSPLKVLVIADSQKHKAECPQARKAGHFRSLGVVDRQRLGAIGIVEGHGRHGAVQFLANRLRLGKRNLGGFFQALDFQSFLFGSFGAAGRQLARTSSSTALVATCWPMCLVSSFTAREQFSAGH